MRQMRVVVGTMAAAMLLAALFATPSTAAVPSVYDGDVACAAQPASGNVRLCSGPTTTWDGQTKIDVNVILPAEPPSGADGPYPTIGVFHGWGGSKIGLEDARTRQWAEEGYVVFSMSDRGWGNSCGSADPDRLPLTAKCAQGYNHLMDTRYEVRDAQHLLGALVDEGLVRPDRIGATGVSYGGGLSMALAALRDRTMLPDDTLVPWTSPKGTPMELAAAVPQWPWTDLAYSLMPNGATLDYVADAPYLGPNGTAPIGVMKASYVTALYTLGQAMSNYAVPGTDPDADLVTWYGLVSAGEPYDANPLAQDVVNEITTHHSSYYIDHSQPPAPLLIQSGWNDDLFPVDEAIRFYNRTRTEYPGDPISLYLMDDGHMRSQSKPADLAAFAVRRDAWFDHYLKGAGPAPGSSVEALTTSCGKPSEGPYAAPSWRELAPGEIRLRADAAKTVAPTVPTDAPIGAAFDPVPAGTACATASGADQAGAASYRLAPAPEPGFTLIGSPTVVADIATLGSTSQLAARQLDVAPDGKQTLVTRGLLRPGAGGKGVVFQLHPQGHRFAPGHVAKLELLPSDAPYSRPSNGQQPIAVSNLELRLPVLEAPGSLGGLVQSPAPKILPPGYRLARDYLAAGQGGAPAPVASGSPRRLGVLRVLRGPLRAKTKGVLVRVRCAGQTRCRGRLSVRLGRGTLARGPYSLAAGRVRRARLPSTRTGRVFRRARLLASPRRAYRARVEVAAAGAPSPFALTRRLRVR
ncbi:MAG TPA: CocE/NonD family hydrolase [Solirubrobacterales bacterium]|nr:CocE/NonD family hydrolase [Solirubrobacterales bacterium]